MDPTANLHEQLRLAAVIIDRAERGAVIPTGDVLRLAELVTELDTWTKRGGALPTQWDRS